MSQTMPLPGQQIVIEFLADPKNHGGDQVEKLETHISVVFLVGKKVYKLKKAVQLPFLDFTTLEARRNACESEVALNRINSPDLYRGLATVTREADGGLALGGQGQVVEYLVAMNRFDQSGLFDRMADRGALSRELMMELAEDIARFHRRAQPRPDRGGRAGLEWVLDTNAACFARYAGTVFDPQKIAQLEEKSRAALGRMTDLLERRRADGFVRQCHGDLHLGNICMYEGHPTLFDAIEFSDTISCIDTQYDLAFLLMDLDRRNRRRLASVVFNHYVALTGDSGAVAAMPLFLACRAAVRAHVSAAMAEAAEGKRRLKLQELACFYLDRALDYLDPPPPRLIAVGGLSGSGKSRMGREVSPFVGGCPGALVARSDVLRKRLMGTELHVTLDAEGYAPEVTERTYQTLFDISEKVLRAGHSVIADAVFARPDQREAIARVAERVGVPFDGLWLEAPEKVMAERITKRQRNVSDATVAVMHAQLAYDLGEITWTRIDSSGPKGESLRMARAALGI